MSDKETAASNEFEKLALDFYGAATPEEGAKAFSAVVDFARSHETMQQSRVERVASVVSMLKPKTEAQHAAVTMAKRSMGFEPSSM